MSGSQEVITRRPRADRQGDPDPDRETPPSVTFEAISDEPDPEEAMAEARRQLAASQQQTAEARRAARQAQQAAQHATAQAHEAATARLTDREIAITSVLDSATAELVAAKAAYRAARESGNIEDEITAQEALSRATTRETAAKTELERIKAAPKPAAQPQQSNPQGGPQMSAEAQAWIDSHPAFNADDEYHAMAILGNNRAIKAGHTEGSQSYVDFIDKFLEEKYGEGHGQIGGNQQVQQPRGRQQQQQRSNAGDGIPPSRHTGAGRGGWKDVPTDLGTVHFQKGSDGALRVRFADKNTHENFIEGAKTSFRALYDRDPDRALADFAEEHINEFLEGGGTIKNGDGRSYG